MCGFPADLRSPKITQNSAAFLCQFLAKAATYLILWNSVNTGKQDKHQDSTHGRKLCMKKSMKMASILL